MATLLSALETQARYYLNAPASSDTFWSSVELITSANLACHDLWRAVSDLRGLHIATLDVTNVSLAANATSLTGVPADCVRVHMLEPRDLSSSGTSRGLTFTPKPYNSPDFQSARAQDATDPSNGEIFWVQMGAGGPVAAPTVMVAPMVTSAVLLSLTYVPVLAGLIAGSANPIPGESDNAVIAWMVAYARAKEREDRAPDPAWLTVYATEKQNLLVSLTPRQDQEPMITTAAFEDYW